MKLGVMKLGASITWSQVSRTAANFDIHSIIGCLRSPAQITGDVDISIITRNTRNTWIPEDMHFVDIMKTDINSHGFDALVVFNGNVNFFGGAEAPDQIMNYVHMNRFNGPIIYVQTDGQLQLKQLWPAIECKDWAKNWKEEDIVVKRDDIIYLSQARRPERVYELCQKKGSVPIKKENIYHFPIEQAILAKRENRIVQKQKEYDLIYGGSLRGGARKKLLEKYYLDQFNLKVALFGNVKRKDFKEYNNMPSFLSKVEHHAFMSALTRGKSTCIIGDEWYFDNMHTLRIYETIRADVVCFVATEFDPRRTIFKDDKLNDFLYVSSKEELADKARSLDAKKLYYITESQTSSIDFNRDSYVNRLYARFSEILGAYKR